MIITAWICLIFFGFFTLDSILKFLIDEISCFHVIVMFISAIITALSAGVIWGGLFQNLIR